MIENNIHISENQIEDALVTNLDYLQNLIDSETEIRLLARQLRLKNGEDRVDILLLNANNLLLIELKITPFYQKHIDQIINYKKELEILKTENKLVKNAIIPILLVTKASKEDITKTYNDFGIKIIIYNPLDVMTTYFNRLQSVSKFMSVSPNEYGVMSIGLINKTLLLYNKGLSLKDVARERGLSPISIRNHLRIATEFGLLKKRNYKYYFTDMGLDYIEAMNDEAFIEELSNCQISIIKEFISKNPFYSSSVFGIYSIVESTFILSRNSYPVELGTLQQFFKIHSGKQNEWNSNRTLQTVTYTFIKLAINLDLLGKIGKKVIITPAGFTFILMLQLHKSINMIDNLENL